MVSKSNEQKIVNANKKRWLSKKEILIIALAITAIIAGIITIIITLNVFTSDSKKDEPTLEETLKSKADFSIRFVNEWEDCTIIFTSNRDDAGWNIVLRR